MKNWLHCSNLCFSWYGSLSLYGHCLFILNLALFLLLLEKTTPTDWLIHLFSTNQLNLLTLHNPLCKGSLRCTIDTNCAKLSHLLSYWNQVHYISEGFSLEGAVKGWDNHNFVHIGQGFAKLDYFWEKLSLVYTNDIIGLAHGKDAHEFVGLECLLGDSE